MGLLLKFILRLRGDSMAKQILFNPITNEKTIVDVEEDDIVVDINLLKSEMLTYILVQYKNTLSQGFVSSVTGEEVKYRYKDVDQLNYSKWANVLALNPLKNSVSFETNSHGFITLTREQFIALMDDIETFEMNMYTKRMGIEYKIKNAVTVDELKAINISL